jgi:hypothetical protein
MHVTRGSLLAVAFLAGGLLFGDDPKATLKTRGSLPQDWSKLGLTDEQKQKAYSIETEYQSKIDALQQQIKTMQQQVNTLEEQKRDELAKVLTDAQKARLKEFQLAARWVVLFQADDPSVWDTDSRGEKFAVPLRWAPALVHYLRLRRMDTGEALILPLTRDQLYNGKTPTREAGYWWNGTAKEEWKGRHLGIAQAPRQKFPTHKDQIHVMTEGWDGFTGSGFGHKCFAGDKQYYCWRGKEIRKTVFQIAVTEGPLSPEEKRCLLTQP